MRGELVRDRHAKRLDRGEPRREGARVMLKQHREEAFDGAEQRAVDHHRTLVRAIGGDVFELETFRKVEVELDGGHLPGTSDGVTGLHGDLRTVEGCAARIVDQVQTGFLGDLGQRVGGFLPNLVGTDVLVRILGGQLQIEVIQTEVLQQAEARR